VGDACPSPLDVVCSAQSVRGDRCADFWRTQRECYDAEELAIIADRERVLEETGCYKGAAMNMVLRLWELDAARLRREPTCRRSPA
jgi:hypothetical protein